MSDPIHWTDDEGARGSLWLGGARLSIEAEPSMTADDGTVIVGVDLPDWLLKVLRDVGSP